MRKSSIYLPLVSVFLLLAGCSIEKQPVQIDGNVTLRETQPDSVNFDENPQLWHATNKKICVLYGYDYNSPEFIKETNKMLFEKYGSAEDDGLILPVVFPDDLKKGTKVYITNLTYLLEDVELQGIILLGAPEGTHYAIARLQDSWGGTLPYPVFSLFPQDDILGIEDSSDFVLDKAQKADINGLINEEEQSEIKEIPLIIDNCVRFISYSDSAFEKNSKLYEVVKKVCKDLKVERYSDPDTGLISINHFVLE